MAMLEMFDKNGDTGFAIFVSDQGLIDHRGMVGASKTDIIYEFADSPDLSVREVTPAQLDNVEAWYGERLAHMWQRMAETALLAA